MNRSLPDEATRLRLLADYAVMDTAPDEDLDAIVALASAICGTPIALVSLVDESRQWFKARIGLDAQQTPRDQAFCAHVIDAPENGLFTVPDARVDARFAVNPLVTGDPGVVFYAAAPLEVEGGARLGTLCVIDRVPRALDAVQQQTLTTLSKLVVRQLQQKRDAIDNAATEARLQAVLTGIGDGVIATDLAGRITFLNPVAAGLTGWQPDECIGLPLSGRLRLIHEHTRERAVDPVERVLREGRIVGTANHTLLVRRDGSEIPIDDSAAPVRNLRGEIAGAVLVFRDVTEKKALEREYSRLLAEARSARAEAERQRETLTLLFEQAPVAIKLLRGPKHVVEFANAAFCRLWGRTPAALEGLELVRALPDVVELGLDAILDGVRATGVGFSGDEIPMQLVRREDGAPEDAFLTLVIQPLRDAHGAIDRLLVVANDVTDAVRARRVLAVARAGAEFERARLYSLFMQTPAVIAVLRGPTHVYDLANPTYRAIIGGRDVVGRPIRVALPELDGQGIFELLDTVYSTGVPFVASERLVQIDRSGSGVAEPVRFSFVYQPLRDASGAIEGILVFAVDVTEQVEARTKIEEIARERQVLLDTRREVERQLERMFSLSLDLISSSRDGRFTKVNPAFERVLGWTPEEIMAVPIDALVHPDEAARTSAERERTRHGASLEDFQSRYRHKDGSYRWIAWNATSEGEDTFAVGRDVTEERAMAAARARLMDEQKAAREAAESATRAMDQFLATVSHELRTPLNAMLGWTRLLRSGQMADTQRPKALATIERNALAQTKLIEDLLDVSRIVAGTMQLEPATVELVTVIESALEVVRPAAEAKGVVLGARLDPNASRIVGDAARLQQVVWNLLANAVKFTPRDGRVEIRLTCIERGVEIAIEDSGEGIAPDFVDHVFERFRQADGTVSRIHGGLGLGLAIAKNLVELHGGSISARSEGRGRGATFTVQLPAETMRRSNIEGLLVAQPRNDGPSPADCPPEIVGMPVLVVDDEPDSRDLLVALLERCGAQVTAVGSAVEAFDRFRDARFTVVISDIGMPGEDGYSLIKRLRSLPRTQGSHVPAIALTAYARVEERTRALRAGFSAHVPKPVNASELLAVIASLVQRSGG